MKLEKLPYDLSVCKVKALADADLDAGFFFVGKTDEELSLVCETSRAPEACIAREDGWKCFRIQGVLDFGLVGVLAEISSALADAGIGIFAVSTYNTDYILVKAADFPAATAALVGAGHEVEA